MKKLILFIAMTLLAACSPKKSAVQANATTTTTVGGATTGACLSTTGATTTTATTANVGTIYDKSANSYNFENQVKGFLSATISPYDVGTISSQGNAQTGVRFSGVIKLDTSGNVIGSQSHILISVYDSIWLMNHYTNPNEVEIQAKFDPATNSRSSISGQFNLQTGAGTLVLQDNYGSVQFTGTIDAQNFSGTVSYQNTTTVLGGTPANGSMGQFFIQRCAILQ